MSSLLGFLLLAPWALAAAASTCNVCGCASCRFGNPLGEVTYPNPDNLEQWLRNNCETLETLSRITNPPIYSQAYCQNELWKYVTPVCECTFANGTAVPIPHNTDDISSGSEQTELTGIWRDVYLWADSLLHPDHPSSAEDQLSTPAPTPVPTSAIDRLAPTPVPTSAWAFATPQCIGTGLLVVNETLTLGPSNDKYSASANIPQGTETVLWNVTVLSKLVTLPDITYWIGNAKYLVRVESQWQPSVTIEGECGMRDSVSPGAVVWQGSYFAQSVEIVREVIPGSVTPYGVMLSISTPSGDDDVGALNVTGTMTSCAYAYPSTTPVPTTLGPTPPTPSPSQDSDILCEHETLVNQTRSGIEFSSAVQVPQGSDSVIFTVTMRFAMPPDPSMKDTLYHFDGVTYPVSIGESFDDWAIDDAVVSVGETLQGDDGFYTKTANFTSKHTADVDGITVSFGASTSRWGVGGDAAIVDFDFKIIAVTCKGGARRRVKRRMIRVQRNKLEKV